MDKKYDHFVKLDGKHEDFGEILKGHNSKPWQGFLRVLGPWRDLPNVLEVDTDQEVNRGTGNNGSNGVKSVTLQLENVVYKQMAAAMGTYHLVQKGQMSPWLGYHILGRQGWPDNTQPDPDWFEVLTSNCQIRIWQGYGTETANVWTGLVDDVDLKSNPMQITITARCFGQILTDSRAFGTNIANEIRSPVTFASRKTHLTAQGGSASASGHASGYPASNVTVKGGQKLWLSEGHSTPATTAWVEVHLPAGDYEDFYVQCHYAGMEMFWSVFSHGTGNQIDGVPVSSGQWLNPDGHGNIAGTAYPYVGKINASQKDGRTYKLGHKFKLGNGSTLRLTFRNLGFSGTFRDYRAGVYRLFANQITHTDPGGKPAKQQHWVLVDDAADVLKWVFMWAGFHEWDVEPMGVPIDQPMVFHQGDYLIDIVNYMLSQGDFAFHVAPPTDNDLSIGVPTFRACTALQAPWPSIPEVKDDHMITGLEAKFTKAELPFIIRVRGDTAPKGKGVTLGEDLDPRYEGVYFPPWSGAHRASPLPQKKGTKIKLDNTTARLAGVRKHFTHGDGTLEDNIECLMACVQTAGQMLLSMLTGSIEYAGYPGIGVDEQISVVERNTGLNMRAWVQRQQSKFVTGANATYIDTATVAFLDTPDMLMVARDYYIVRDYAARYYAEHHGSPPPPRPPSFGVSGSGSNAL